MIHLQPDTADQTFYATPYEARKFLATFTNYLIRFTSTATEEEHFAVLSVLVDNERYTKARINTNVDNTNNVLIKDSGLYTYTIWGQNSDSNLDPANAAVVGVCEEGAMKISDAAAWTIPAVSIPDNVIYYE
jgi:hypothetical protein